MTFEEEFEKFKKTKNLIYKKFKVGRIIVIFIAIPFFFICSILSFFYLKPVFISAALMLFCVGLFGIQTYFSKYELVDINPHGMKSNKVYFKWSDITKIHQNIFLDIEISFSSTEGEQKILIPNVPLMTEYISRFKAKETKFHEFLKSMVESSLSPDSS